MGHQHHLPTPPACSSANFVDNREKIKQWISEQGDISAVMFTSCMLTLNVCVLHCFASLTGICQQLCLLLLDLRCPM